MELQSVAVHPGQRSHHEMHCATHSLRADHAQQGSILLLSQKNQAPVVTVFGQDGEPVVNLINAWSLVIFFGHKMKLVTHNTQGDLALRGSFLQPQEVVGLENAGANLQVNLVNITGLQETAVMSISPEGHVWSKGHYFYLMVNVAAIRTFHITTQTQDCAMKLVELAHALLVISLYCLLI
jgi:hypothetical protein